MLGCDCDVNERTAIAHLLGVGAEIYFEDVVAAGIVQSMDHHESIWHHCFEFENSQFSSGQTDGVMFKATNAPAERCYE